MNKEEIQAELKRARAAETTIKNNIIELLEQLVEAEKPKLRHGDFGYVWDEGEKEKPSRFVVTNHKGGLYWSRHSGLPSLIPLCHLTEHKYTILGNIFDLLKEWGKPFEEWDKTLEATEIRIEDNMVRLYACTGAGCEKDVCHCKLGIKRAEDFWRKLGHAIFTLKRKENKCS